MVAEFEYRKRISEYNNWKKLKRLWNQIQKGTTKGWEPGKAFEYLILQAFYLDGADVEWPFTINYGEIIGSESKEIVEQIDGFILAAGIPCLIECKDRKNDDVDIQAIAKLRNQMSRRSTHAVGSVFSRQGFTQPAILLSQFISPELILLWTGSEIEYALEKQAFVNGLKAKYRAYLTKGISDHSIVTGDIE